MNELLRSCIMSSDDNADSLVEEELGGEFDAYYFAILPGIETIAGHRKTRGPGFPSKNAISTIF